MPDHAADDLRSSVHDGDVQFAFTLAPTSVKISCSPTAAGVSLSATMSPDV
jgi:hypothetical protein